MNITSGCLSRKFPMSIFWAHSHQYSQRLLVISGPRSIKGPPAEMIPMLHDGLGCIYEPPHPPTCWRDRALTSHPPAPSPKPVLRIVCAWRAWRIIEYTFNFSWYQKQYRRTVEAERVCVCVGGIDTKSDIRVRVRARCGLSSLHLIILCILFLFSCCLLLITTIKKHWYIVQVPKKTRINYLCNI